MGFHAAVQKAKDDAIRSVFGPRRRFIIWAQAVAFAIIGLAGSQWLARDAWLGASAETYRTTFSLLVGIFVAVVAIVGTGYSFVFGLMQQRYAAARDHINIDSLVFTGSEGSQFVQVFRRADNATEFDLPLYDIWMKSDANARTSHATASLARCADIARDARVYRRYVDVVLESCGSFAVMSFVFLAAERYYNPAEFAVVGWLLLQVTKLTTRLLTSSRIVDTDNMVKPSEQDGS